MIRREKRASRSCSVPAGFALVEFIASSTGGWPDATAGAPRGGGAGGVELRGGLLRRIYCGRHHISHNCGAPWFARPFVGLPRLQIRGQFKVLELVHQLKELAALRALGDGAACAHRISQKESASQEGTTPRTPEALSAAVHLGMRARARAPTAAARARRARALSATLKKWKVGIAETKDESCAARGVSARLRAFSRAPARSADLVALLAQVDRHELLVGVRGDEGLELGLNRATRHAPGRRRARASVAETRGRARLARAASAKRAESAEAKPRPERIERTRAAREKHTSLP